MRILELGSYIVPAYAGMMLAEQGHAVEKWTVGTDPILSLKRGDELWRWINHGKTLVARHMREVPAEIEAGRWDVVIDNVRPSTLARHGIEPAAIAEHFGVRWVSMRSEVGEVSFDALAQARAWLSFAPWMPFYIGDTAGGLFVAFKAVADRAPGHFVLGHASCLTKLVEGEMVVKTERQNGRTPWDIEQYGAGPLGAVVDYRNERYSEPVRDDAWREQHLFHTGGRIKV